jgi:hypothetical protein
LPFCETIAENSIRAGNREIEADGRAVIEHVHRKAS